MWTDDDDEAFEQLMEEFPRWLPALERAVDTDSRIDDLERRLTELESRVPRRNELLEAVKQKQLKGDN